VSNERKTSPVLLAMNPMKSTPNENRKDEELGKGTLLSDETSIWSDEESYIDLSGNGNKFSLSIWLKKKRQSLVTSEHALIAYI
jgi:hypothetical protein